MSMFSAAFDDPAMKEIALFYSFEVLLQPEVQLALVDISTQIADEAVSNTWQVFANPQGNLAGTILPILGSRYEAQVEVGSPYGERREKGFLNMTDSLGRTFPHDIAKPYLAPAVEAKKQYALMRVEEACAKAFARMTGGG